MEPSVWEGVKLRENSVTEEEGKGGKGDQEEEGKEGEEKTGARRKEE